MKHPTSALALPLIGLGLAPAPAAEPGYFLDASACAAEAVVTERIDLNSGIYTEQAIVSSPLSIEVKRELNEAAYGECMRQRGRLKHVKDNPYLRIIAECQDAARATPKVLIGGTDRGTLTASHNLAAYERCVEQRTRELDVEVQIPSPER